MDLAASFMPLLQVFAFAMTEPTSESLRQLIAGWVFAPRRTVLGMIRFANANKHLSADHRIFASAVWLIDCVGLALFDLVTKLAPQDTYFVDGDDTTLARSGLKVFGAGMHRDACLSSRAHAVVRWGHRWFVLFVVSSRKDDSRKFTIPILMPWEPTHGL